MYMDCSYVRQNPKTVQKLADAFVRTMRWIHSHNAAQVAAKMPTDYNGGDPALYQRSIKDSSPMFTTDGRIPGLNLKVLEDDKHFFPLYNLTEVIQQDVLKQYPVLKKIFAKLNPKLTNPTMQKLNAKVDVAGEDPSIVARDFLVHEGLVKP